MGGSRDKTDARARRVTSAPQPMRIPSRKELDQIFRGRTPVALKLAGCAFVGGLVTLSTTMRLAKDDEKLTPLVIGLFTLVAAALGALVGVGLWLKDGV